MKEPVSLEDKNHYLPVPRQRIRTDGEGDGRKNGRLEVQKSLTNISSPSIRACLETPSIQSFSFLHRLSSNEGAINLLSFFSFLFSLLLFLFPPLLLLLSLSPCFPPLGCLLPSCILPSFLPPQLKMSEEGSDG